MNSIRSPLYELYKYYFKGFKVEQEICYRFVKLITPSGMLMDTITLLNDEEREILWREAKWIG